MNSLISSACEQLQRNLTEGEWNTFIKLGPEDPDFMTTCDGIVVPQ
jgi:hypothetical protein